jgi:hypothetical protein
MCSKNKRFMDSIHAEEMAINKLNYLKKIYIVKKLNKIKIIIWKKSGSAFCCCRCKKVIDKSNISKDNIITPEFKNNKFTGKFIPAYNNDISIKTINKH